MLVATAALLLAEEPSSIPAAASTATALWVADSAGFAEFSGKHLLLAFSSTGGAPSSIAFDSLNNFWGTMCTNVNGNAELGLIFELTQTQILEIETGLEVFPVVELQNPKGPPNFDCPSALQFDISGNLWVANKGADTKKPSIMKFTTAQLEAGGKLAPVFFTSPAIDTIWDMKFDPSGNLWLAADPVPPNNNGGIFEIKGNQLTAVGPQVVATFNQELTSSALNLPTTLAFDNGGNLWTAGNGDTLLLFSSSDLGGSGVVSLNPTVTLSSSIRKNHNDTFFNPDGLAVDEGGNLWVSSAKNGGGPKKKDGAISEFSSSGIGTTGTPQPSIYIEAKPLTKHPGELTIGPLL